MILADLAAAETRASKSSEAARDYALIFFSLLQRAHICIVVVSIVIYTVLDVVTNTYLMRPIKRCFGDDFKTVLFVISPVTDTK